MTLSKHCHRVHLSKVRLKVCFSVLQQHDGVMDRSVCVWEGLVMWASVNVAVSPPPVCICWGFVFSTHADLLLEASLQWPSSHMRCECINASSISSISVTECLFGGAWCQAVFITGLSQRDHSCFFFFFSSFSLTPSVKHFEPSHVCRVYGCT